LSRRGRHRLRPGCAARAGRLEAHAGRWV